MSGLEIVNCEAFEWGVPQELPELRVVVAGAGKMARLHLQTLKAMPGVRVVGICNRISDAGRQLSREFGIEHAYQNLDQLLSECSPDAALVAVSHAATCEVAASILRSGIPCLVEKPAGYSTGEVEQLASLAEANHCVNMVGVNRRYYSVINQALLAVQHHGPVRGVLVEAHEPLLRFRNRRQFEDWVYDKWMIANTVHAIDLLRMIGGDVADVKVHSSRIGAPGGESFSASIQFESGILGTLIAHNNTAGGFGLKIYGQGVTAELFPLERGFMSYDTGSRAKLTADWSDTQFKAGLYAQDSSFLQAVADGVPAPYPASDLRDHAKTLRLVEQIQSATQEIAATCREPTCAA